jgi:hypothetical protein
VNGRVNIVPDGTPFVRGDSNGDATVNITDARHALNYLFLRGATPPCLDAADANDDGKLNITDPIAILILLFRGGSPLPPPATPGLDPTADGLDCAG